MKLTNFAALMDRDNKALKYFGGGPQNARGKGSRFVRKFKEEGVFVKKSLTTPSAIASDHSL